MTDPLPMQAPLCRTEDLKNPGTREFQIPLGDRSVDIFVVRKDDRICAYVNRCPHKGVPLNWQPDDFLDDQGKTIVCATHGAVFRPEDGKCLAGPCRGQSLTPVAIEIRAGTIYVPTEDS